ncbi:MAG: leucine-rich repeat domain-containing protein [Lachnospiraceae bacterium]|nr:leucine-rich repeat domain-containing protein [Lachnospiraceae bacterium]
MKKILISFLGALILVSLIMILIPKSDVLAKSGTSDFDIKGSVLLKYSGKGSSCSIPSGVTSIAPEAFSGSNITEVSIPSFVKTIGNSAFYNCKRLARVTVENGVTSIGRSAFAGCEKLNSVMIPASVNEIGAGAFAGCSSLSTLQIDSRNTNFFLNDGVLYNYDSTRLLQYLPGKKAETYTMPFSVKEIEEYAFWKTGSLTEVRVSNQVKEIPNYAFSNCVSLIQVFLPESVTEIQDYAFQNCGKLTYVGMEGDPVKIADHAFEGCNKKLVTQMGIDEKTYQSNRQKNTTKANNTGSQQKTSVSTNKSTSKNQRKSITSSSVKKTEIDLHSPDGLIGAGKIVNGNVLVIISENKGK